jgi:hypothetical protein
MWRGEIRREDYDRISEESRKPEKVAVWKAEVEQKLRGAPWAADDADQDDPTLWERIRAWIMANWPAILKIILSLLVFVEEPKLRDDKKDDKKDGKITDERPDDYKLH